MLSNDIIELLHRGWKQQVLFALQLLQWIQSKYSLCVEEIYRQLTVWIKDSLCTHQLTINSCYWNSRYTLITKTYWWQKDLKGSLFLWLLIRNTTRYWFAHLAHKHINYINNGDWGVYGVQPSVHSSSFSIMTFCLVFLFFFYQFLLQWLFCVFPRSLLYSAWRVYSHGLPLVKETNSCYPLWLHVSGVLRSKMFTAAPCDSCLRVAKWL